MPKTNNYYYNIENDMKAYPEAFCYIIIGGRNCGKTYSTLKSCLIKERDFIFLKRTMEDVDLLCAGSGAIGKKNNNFGVDLSPFKSINRDMGTDVRAHSIKKGIGAFYEHNEEGECEGLPIGHLLALNAVSKYKGFDLASSKREQWLIFDEFIPQPWDRVQRKEGEQLMDLYKTVSRDREHRGLEPLKLICLANATSISNPVMNTLEVTNVIAKMALEGKESLYLDDRGIFIHIVKDNPEFTKVEKDSKIYKAMGDTAWGHMAFDNEFGYNDFSSIGRTSLKGYVPRCAISYKHYNWYIYQKGGKWYMTNSRHDSDIIYNLNKENDQKKFYFEFDLDLRDECIEGNMLFEEYLMYDLIVNYKKYFIL